MTVLPSPTPADAASYRAYVPIIGVGAGQSPSFGAAHPYEEFGSLERDPSVIGAGGWWSLVTSTVASLFVGLF
jgi:hypothetical protein